MFSNKVVVITGAAAGMGEALAKRLASEGARIVATDVDTKGGRATVKEIEDQGGRAEFHHLDVRDKTEFENLLKEIKQKYGSLDYLFNNAGIAIMGEMRDQTDEDWQRMIDINQMGVLYGSMAAYRIMIKQGSGHIVNTASVAGLVPTPMLSAYSMTKHAVVGLSGGLRAEGKALGVKVSAVCPGIIRTNITDNDFMRNATVDNPFEYMERRMKSKTLSAEQAVDFIVKGVKKNQAHIVFPSQANLAVKAARIFGSLTEGGVQAFVKVYRKELRNS